RIRLRFYTRCGISSEEVTRLNSHLSIGDEVRVSVRAQTDVNGCKWIATSATKVIKCREPTITGCGKIMSLTDSHAIVYSVTHGEIRSVFFVGFCPMLLLHL
ncbi:hypothetical protein KIN20_022028, partial [Parelaphostrongylus tenuis]